MKHTNWRSWLPAISFGIVLHIIILAIFFTSATNTAFNNRKNSIAHTTTDSTSTNHLNVISENNQDLPIAIDNDDIDLANNTSNQPLITQSVTVTKAPYVVQSAQQDDQTNAQPTPSNKFSLDLDLTSSDKSVSIATDQANVADTNTVNTTTIEPSVAEDLLRDKRSTNTLPANTVVMNNTEQVTVDSSNSNRNLNTNDTKALEPNPADMLLTKRDLSQKDLNDMFQGHNNLSQSTLSELEQTERINNELSQLINNVRARNAAKIAQDQQSQHPLITTVNSQATSSNRTQEHTQQDTSTAQTPPADTNNSHTSQSAVNHDNSKINDTTAMNEAQPNAIEPLLSQPDAISYGDVQIIPYDASDTNAPTK